MVPSAACVWERKRTYGVCRDLHQTQSVLAAVSGRGALRESDLPSLELTQEDLRICFEATEDGQGPRGNRASDFIHVATQTSLCIAKWGAQRWSQEASS